jgi:serine/threonine protein kinase
LFCNSAIGAESEEAALAQLTGRPTAPRTMVAGTTGGAGWRWEPPSLAAAARLFPSYQIIEVIGRGGMGVVYKAKQVALDRFVAIKLLPLEVSKNGAFADRFAREAKTLAMLNHPNIVAVHDFGKTEEGHLFFVMEFIHGTNLWQLIHGVGIEPSQAMEIFSSVCDALLYAHMKGVVHRDVKPANVLLDTEGRIKVADFGLARMNSTNASGPAFTGPVMGTPEYMAPEHLRDVNVDHRADIYSLGVMLYEMLCRDLPRGAFDLPSRRTKVDARVDAVVIKAMQQVPDRRYQSTGDMKSAIEAIRTAPLMPTPRPTPAPVPVPRAAIPPLTPKAPARRGYGGFIGGGALVAAGVAAMAYFGSQKQTPPPAGAAATPTPAPKTAPAPPKREPRDELDVVTFANSKYQLVPGALSWSAAKSRAEALGGHLAVIDTRLEDDFLRQAYGATLRTPQRFILIGGHRAASGDGWKWVTGTEWHYTGWAAGEPAHAGATPAEMPVYAVLARSSGPVAWNARSAADETKPAFKRECFGFLVEWDTAPPRPPSEPVVVKPVPSESKPPPPTAPAPAPVPSAGSQFAILLAAKHAEWQAIYERDVAEPHKKAVEEVKAQILAGIDRLLAAAKQPGQLNAALALRSERQRFSTGGDIPADDEAATPDAVKKLRAEARLKLAQLDREREARARALHAKYDLSLETTQKALQQNRELADAKLVGDLRDEIKATWVKPLGSAASAPPPQQPAVNTPKGTTQSRAAKIPLRKLAELLLARNATVNIREKPGKSAIELKSADLLVDDEFEITAVQFRRPLEKPDWTDEDTALLDNVAHVAELSFIGANITDAVLDRIRGSRDLAVLRLANLTQLTPASAPIVSSLPNLQTLSLNSIPWPAEALKAVAQHRKIEVIEFENSALSNDLFASVCAMPSLERIKLAGNNRGLTEAGWQALATARKLKAIEISGGEITPKVASQIARAAALESIKMIARPVTDSDIAPLSTLTRLKTLSLERTKITGAGFGTWPVRHSLINLDLRGAGRVDDASLKGLCAAFPKLELLEFTAGKGQLSAAGAAHLGRLQHLKTLRIHGDGFTDDCAAEIAKADSIEELNVGNSVVTEAGLVALSKLEHLKRLHLYSPVISDATLKALGKIRGLKELIVGQGTEEDIVRKLQSALDGISVRR